MIQVVVMAADTRNIIGSAITLQTLFNLDLRWGSLLMAFSALVFVLLYGRILEKVRACFVSILVMAFTLTLSP